MPRAGPKGMFDRLLWHADYAETQIHSVSTESARSVWEMCRVLARRLRRLFCFCGICKIGVENCQDSCYRHLLSKLCDSLIIILCGCHLTKTGMFPNSLYAIGGCWGLFFYILVTFLSIDDLSLTLLVTVYKGITSEILTLPKTLPLSTTSIAPVSNSP